ncbi:MAG: FHA domain-containing protein [Lachnospiraceae bacterium]|nr:FHA domain-containing protein [Lachnospiraceae bacterium]
MIVSEYVRGLKNNYVRIRELSLPDERKYQYCIMKRGGITGLLSFEIRYIDSDAYMYYDITSRQNLSTLYSKKPLDRNWVISFFTSMKRIKDEAVRFLLDPGNLVWNPSNIFQDLKTGKFGYLYVPYLNEDNGMSEMMDFMVSHVDYSDDELVKCVYSVAEQYKTGGDVYLSDKVYSDISGLGLFGEVKRDSVAPAVEDSVFETEEGTDSSLEKSTSFETGNKTGKDMEVVYTQAEKIGNAFKAPDERPLRLKPGLSKDSGSKRTTGFKELLLRMRTRDKKFREEYDFGYGMDSQAVVAEEPVYSDPELNEDNGGTVFVELPQEESTHRLMSETGRILHVMSENSCVIGKKEDEVDLFIDDEGVSRMHARIFKSREDYYVEDLNSTNGTFKNGVRLKPYEQRKLAAGDELKLAARKIIFS